MEYNSEGVLCSLLISSKFAFYLTGIECILYCDCKPLAAFLPTGMSSDMLDRLALELQQFNIKFQHIQGKKNIVADAVSWLRTLSLYQDNDNEDVPLSTEDIVKNVIEEFYSTQVTQRIPMYNVDKLNLDILQKEQ